MDYLPIAIGQAGNQINFELSKMILQNNESIIINMKSFIKFKKTPFTNFIF